MARRPACSGHSMQGVKSPRGRGPGLTPTSTPVADVVCMWTAHHCSAYCSTTAFNEQYRHQMERVETCMQAMIRPCKESELRPRRWHLFKDVLLQHGNNVLQTMQPQVQRRLTTGGGQSLSRS